MHSVLGDYAGLPCVHMLAAQPVKPLFPCSSSYALLQTVY
jgi:hypothetical protein